MLLSITTDYSAIFVPAKLSASPASVSQALRFDTLRSSERFCNVVSENHNDATIIALYVLDCWALVVHLALATRTDRTAVCQDAL